MLSHFTQGFHHLLLLKKSVVFEVVATLPTFKLDEIISKGIKLLGKVNIWKNIFAPLAQSYIYVVCENCVPAQSKDKIFILFTCKTL